MKSVAFRLTLMYAGISALSLLAVLVVSYFVLGSSLRRRLDQSLLNEVMEYGALLETQSLEVLRDVLEREAVSEGTDQVFFRVLDGSGTEILASEMASWSDVGANQARMLEAAQGRTVFETHRHDERAYPVRIAYGLVAPGLVLQLGESMGGNVEVLRQFRQVFELAAMALVLCSIMAGGVMARRALSGVQQVTQTARDIASGAWDSRVPQSDRNDEIDELAAAFNDMVGRVQVLLRELREVTDDIAHDLRTPIMRMRATAETALGKATANEAQTEMAGSILEECDGLLGLINTTLEISQTEAGAKPLACERVDVSSTVEDVFELFQSPAEDKGVTVELRQEPGLFVDADPQGLRRALAHIVDNAVKYTRAGGRVDIAAARRGDQAVVSVSDTGVGIAEGDLTKVFARFYRGDESRSENGNGLGLTLSRAICRAHGGDVTVASELGGGSTFEVSLPLAAD